jgi:diacylglycerol O-acyltransferase / wax synthase
MPGPAARIERASANDLMELASDVGPAPMQVGAVLVLGADPGLPAVRAAIDRRIRQVPRMRQRLVRVPPGCGRPVWVDDPGFDIAGHVRGLRCPAPGDEAALLSAAAAVLTSPLPADRPPWSATLVSGLAAGGAALVLVIHHVLTDGIGGLAMLASLVDGGVGGEADGTRGTGERPAENGRPEDGQPHEGPIGERRPADWRPTERGRPAGGSTVGSFPRPAPTRRELLVEAAAGRARVVAHPLVGLRLLRAAVTELRAGATGRVPRCSLNRPTGPRRRFAVARADLAAVRAAGHAQGGTVNDVVLAAVAGALRSVLRQRGERPGRLVASVPVSARRAAGTATLGNQVGVRPVELPDLDDPARRLAAVARTTRALPDVPRGASAAVLTPLLRLLGRLGLLRWYVDRQRMVSTFVTNVRGPAAPLSFLGSPVTALLPLPATTGNVTVAFAVLSYAGTLAVTVLADPDACPDLALLAGSLQGELDRLSG